MENILQIQDISKTYKGSGILFRKKDKLALDHVSFDIKKGEIFGLVGESGSGKTTLSNIILRLVKESSGKILFKEKDIANLNKDEIMKYRREVQVVFQNPYQALNPKKTIGFSIEEILNIHDIYSKDERRKIIRDLLEEIEMEEDVLNYYPASLSGGQKQRIAIAQALVINPEFLIIDEGVSALDVSIQAQILNLIRSLQKKHNFTSLFISHDLNVIAYLCDRIGVLYKGELVDLFDTYDLESDDRHEYTKELFKSISL
ncbi:MAG: ATP-binding cassette domain-containing protein [Anaerococcus sp.]|nr:ATP-binding cassette domain-containing protein [Anaerococcus sp.]MDD7043811.1 ATP-binding cassette domain-containing protein [Peptoniphilaceae bacterium]MDY2919568.1 ATP-binding cassette domain-containing protein [Anaerococcus sp.]